MTSRKAKPNDAKPLEEIAIAKEKRRRRRVSAAVTVTRAGLKVEQMLQFLVTQERRTGEPVARSWVEWGATLKCDPKTAKRNAAKAFDLGLLQIVDGVTRHGGDYKNRFAVDWVGIAEALGEDVTPTFDRGTKCPGEGGKMPGGGGQNAPAYKDISLGISLDNSLSTTSTRAGEATKTTTKEVFADEGKAAELEAAIAAVAKAGVDPTNAKSFTRRAFERGDDVGAVVDAWRSLAATWEPSHAAAILAVRLRDGVPGCGPREGWPAPKFPEKLPKPPKPQICPVSEPPGETAKESTARLEATHGASLDAMPIEKRLALLSDGEIKILGRAVSGGGARNFLLAKLEGLEGGSKKTEIRAASREPQNAHSRHGPANLQVVGACLH